MHPTEQVFEFFRYNPASDAEDHIEPFTVRMCDYQLNQIEEYLLAAALLQGRTSEADNTCASADKVMKQALHLGGLSVESIVKLWTAAHWDKLTHPNLFDQYYDTLIGMTDKQIQKSDQRRYPLFEANGNWGQYEDGPPAYPDFNACRLSCVGEEFAKVLLELHPEFSKLVIDTRSIRLSNPSSPPSHTPPTLHESPHTS
jgi:hypothetical protein